MNVKVIRLKTGEDVIAHMESTHETDIISLWYPMNVQILNRTKFTQILLTHFLPFEIVEDNLCTINFGDVLLVLEPKESFKEYYIKTVEKLMEIDEPYDLGEPDPITETLIDLDQNLMTKQ
jgi:hypothetical protein